MQENNENITKIISRLEQYAVNQGINFNQIAQKIGVSNSYFSKMVKSNGSLGEDIIRKILLYYDNINTEWLITGAGDMLKSKKEIEIKPVDNEWILKRFEELVAENALLKKEVEELRITRGKPANTTNYPEFSTKIGSGIAAESQK
jgi:transcriptional regulator with XRE-family HTH domain